MVKMYAYRRLHGDSEDTNQGKCKFEQENQKRTGELLQHIRLMGASTCNNIKMVVGVAYLCGGFLLVKCSFYHN